MEEEVVRMSHYFKRSKPGKKVLIPFTLKGYTLEFISYTSLFSGREVDLGTKLLLENIRIPSKGVVLDVGCGYGVIGISIAKLNPQIKVYMIDINPLAVKVSKQNAKRNGVEDRVVVLHGDRYEPVKNMKFDAIYSNPPLSAGMDIVEDIILNAYKHLKINGYAQFVLARGGEYIVEKANNKYNVVETIRKKGYILLYVKP